MACHFWGLILTLTGAEHMSCSGHSREDGGSACGGCRTIRAQCVVGTGAHCGHRWGPAAQHTARHTLRRGGGRAACAVHLVIAAAAKLILAVGPEAKERAVPGCDDGVVAPARDQRHLGQACRPARQRQKRVEHGCGGRVPRHPPSRPRAAGVWRGRVLGWGLGQACTGARGGAKHPARGNARQACAEPLLYARHTDT